MLKWKNDISLVTSRFFIYDVLRACFLAYILMNLMLLITGLLVDGLKSYGWDLPLYSGITILGVGVAILLVAILFFGNRMPFEFAVNEKGASMEMLSRKAKAANRAAFFLGLFAGKPSVAGAGAIAASREYTEVPWSSIFKANYYDRARIITLMNSWRAVIRLYCTEENYQEVKESVTTWIAQAAEKRERINASEDHSADHSIDTRALALTATKLIAVSLAAVFALVSPISVPEWLVTTAWVGGLIMVMFPPLRILSSLIVISGFLAILGMKIISGLEKFNIYDNLKDHPEYRPAYADYSAFDNFDGGEWTVFVLMAVFILVVVAMASRYLGKREQNKERNDKD